MSVPGNLDPTAVAKTVTAVDRLETYKRATQLNDYLEYVRLTESKLGPYRDAEAKTKIEEFITSNFPENEQSGDGRLLEELCAVRGPFVEIGGPSPNFSIVDIADLSRASGKKLQVTNVKPEELRRPVDDRLVGSVEIAGVVDARHMNFADGSVGALFASGLPYMIMERFLSESARTLEPGGLLLLKAAGNMDVAVAITKGFYPVKYSRNRLTWDDGFYEDLWEVAFKKPAYKQKTLKLGRFSFTASMRQ